MFGVTVTLETRLHKLNQFYRFEIETTCSTLVTGASSSHSYPNLGKTIDFNVQIPHPLRQGKYPMFSWGGKVGASRDRDIEVKG